MCPRHTTSRIYTLTPITVWATAKVSEGLYKVHSAAARLSGASLAILRARLVVFDAAMPCVLLAHANVM